MLLGVILSQTGIHTPLCWTSGGPVTSFLQIMKFLLWELYVQHINNVILCQICRPQRTLSAFCPSFTSLRKILACGIDFRGTPLSQNLNLWAPIECICKWIQRIPFTSTRTGSFQLFSDQWRQSAHFSYMGYDRNCLCENQKLIVAGSAFGIVSFHRVNILPKMTLLSYADSHCSTWLFRNRRWSYMNLVYLPSHCLQHASFPAQVSSSRASPSWVHYQIACVHSTAAHTHTDSWSPLGKIAHILFFPR